jgi:anti-sigma factor RsiW
MDEWTAKLDAYVDGELSTAGTQALDAHLRNCPACKEELLRALQLKRALHSAGRRFSPSPEFRSRLLRKYAGMAPGTGWARWLIPAAVVVILFAIGLAATYVNRTRMERQQRFSEIADLYVGTLASANPVDVASSDKHTVKPWFEGKLPFTFNLPEQQSSEFSLVGGRVVYLRHAPGAELIFQIRKHRLSAFIFEERAVGQRLPTSGTVMESAFHVQTWSENGLRYFVISDAAAADISRLSELLKNANRS